MLLRKLVAALCPLLLCLVLCLLYRWLDGVLGAGLFWSFLLKGLLLGVMLALIIPLAGLRCHSKGLQRGRGSTGRDPVLSISGNRRSGSFQAAAIPFYPEWSGHPCGGSRRRVYDRHRPAFQALTPLKRIKSPLSSTDRRKRVFHIF
mgnify:CR=1 FL=1